MATAPATLRSDASGSGRAAIYNVISDITLNHICAYVHISGDKPLPGGGGGGSETGENKLKESIIPGKKNPWR